MQYNVLMCESLMSLYKPNSWSSMHSIRTRKNLHWILQAIGGSLAMAGMIILYSLRGFQIRSIHSQLGKYTSLQHWLFKDITDVFFITYIGFGSSILIIIGALSGSTAIWSAELRRLVKPVYIKLAHNLTGSLCFTMGMSALIYGYQSFVFNNTTTRETLVALQVMCALIIVLCMVGPLTSLYTQCVGSFPWIFKRFEKNDEIEDDEDDQRRNINNYT